MKAYRVSVAAIVLSSICLTTSLAEETETQTRLSNRREAAQILIQPGRSFVVAQTDSKPKFVNTSTTVAQAAVAAPAKTNLPLIVASGSADRRYAEVYRTISFSRAEYTANPSYRHEATMEILTGKLRSITIHKYSTTAQPNSNWPAARGVSRFYYTPTPHRRFSIFTRQN